MNNTYSRFFIASMFSVVLCSMSYASIIETGFTTNDSAEPLIIKSIKATKKQILVAAYSFTNKRIAMALVEAKNRGVNVFVVLDKSQLIEKYSAVTFLSHAKMPVRIDESHAIMHNKYMIYDSKTVETGSYNFTSSATNRNAENVIMIWNDPIVAGDYANDWKTHWDHAQQIE